MNNFTGQWFTTYGIMKLNQQGNNVEGTYGAAGAIHGTAKGVELQFRYTEPGESGEGRFQLQRYGKFTGQYCPDAGFQGFPWEGLRDFDGIWDTSFGRLRLIQTEERVFGFYEGVGPATIDGHIEDGRLVFHYQEPTARGQGRFELGEDGRSFTGQWCAEGQSMWQSWSGKRISATPGLSWLVVLEAHWQRSLADNEYAFGHMLREFFARLANVKVRQRFFHDEASLRHWCRELLYLAEPAILMIASHGSPEGLSVNGQTINTRSVIDSLEYADNLKLLHFSSCLVMQDGGNGAALHAVLDQAAFPISGYTTSVDWGGSALIEFTYLDMILGKHLPPAVAAAKLPALLNFAGDNTDADSPYAAAGFRFFQGRHQPGNEPEKARPILWAGM